MYFNKFLIFIILLSLNIYPDIINKVLLSKNNQGYVWEFDNKQTQFLNGVVYQPVPDEKHIDDYVSKNNFYDLYKFLLPNKLGGLDHGEQLQAINVNFIRIYQLSTTDNIDISKVKDVFRYIHKHYGIHVLLGNWAGLHKDPNDYDGIQKNVENMIRIYGTEDWVIGFLIGNENNYFHNEGILRNENTPEDLRIELSVPDYYNFMNRLAKTAKKLFKILNIQKPIGLGCGEIFPYEVESVKQEVKDYDFIGYNCYRTVDRMNDYLILLKKRGVTLPVMITEFGTPVGGTALWGIQEINPFSKDLPYNLLPVVPKSNQLMDLFVAVQKNYLREQYGSVIDVATKIIDDNEVKQKAMDIKDDFSLQRSLKQIYTEALLLRGLSYKILKQYDKAKNDFKNLTLNFQNILIWSLPFEPITFEERANIYWNAVNIAKNNSMGKGIQNVIGICCFEFTSEMWNNINQNRGFEYQPSEDVKVDDLLNIPHV